MKKSVDMSCQDQLVAKDDTRTSKRRSALASSKLEASRLNNKEKLAGHLGKCQQTSLTEMSKLQSVPVMKRKFEKSGEASPKVLSVYNLRSKVPINEGAKDSPAFNLRSKVQKVDGQKASTKKTTPKKDGSIQKGGQKAELQRSQPPKSSAPPSDKILTTSLDSPDKKKQPLTSPFEPFFTEPMYHIRWEGDDMEDGPVGQNCVICNKDLSGIIEDDSEYDDDDLQYEHDEEDDDDDVLDYYDDLNPPLLPAVDILVCGHAYHTECFQKGTPEKQSGDPECPFCSKNA